MPIANCVFASGTPADPDAIVTAWSAHAGVASDEMTVNVIAASQGGKRYAVIAWLYLPSVWPGEEVVRLGEGLAAALADVAGAPPSEVQVLTTARTGVSVCGVASARGAQ